MAELDVLAPNYRRAKERWPDAATLSRCHGALTTCFEGNAHGMVEHVKSFVECVCVTILGEFRAPMPSNANTTRLLIAALSPLGLQNSRGASHLDDVLSGFNKLADALTAMRNDNGPVAHGKDAFLDAVTADHARAFLHAGDAILSVLLNSLEAKEPDLTATREPYENFPHLNERIDRSVAVEVRVDEDGPQPVVVLTIATGAEAIELRVEPSRLLYGVDRFAYIEVLRTTAGGGDDGKEAQVAVDEEMEPPDLATGPLDELATTVVESYAGRLLTLRTALTLFLAGEGVSVPRATDGEADIEDSLLATAERNMGLDWKQRDTLQARLKIACKRVFVRFGVDGKKAEDIAEKFVVWLRVQAPDMAMGSDAPLQDAGAPT